MKKKIGLILAAVMVINTASSIAYGFKNPLKEYNLYEDTHGGGSGGGDPNRESVVNDILPSSKYTSGSDSSSASASSSSLPDVPSIEDAQRDTTLDHVKTRNQLLRESSQRVFANKDTKPAWETNPSFYPNPSFESIKAKYKKSDFAGCMQECESYVRKHPNDTLGFYYLAMCYAKVDDKDNAIRAYEEVIALNANPMIVKYATNGRNCVMGNENEQCFPNVNEPELIYPYADFVAKNAANLTPVDPQTLINRNLNQLKAKLNPVVQKDENNQNANDSDNKNEISLPFGTQDAELDKFINAPYGNGLSPQLNNEYKQIQLKKIQKTINNGETGQEHEQHNWKNIKDFDNHKTDADTIKLAYEPSAEWQEIQKDPEYIKNQQDFEQLQMMLGTSKTENSTATSDITNLLPYMTKDNNTQNMTPEMIQTMMLQSMMSDISL